MMVELFGWEVQLAGKCKFALTTVLSGLLCGRRSVLLGVFGALLHLFDELFRA